MFEYTRLPGLRKEILKRKQALIAYPFTPPNWMPEIEFVAAVRQGLDELDRGEGISIEEVERELPAWIIR